MIDRVCCLLGIKPILDLPFRVSTLFGKKELTDHSRTQSSCTFHAFKLRILELSIELRDLDRLTIANPTFEVHRGMLNKKMMEQTHVRALFFRLLRELLGVTRLLEPETRDPPQRSAELLEEARHREGKPVTGTTKGGDDRVPCREPELDVVTAPGNEIEFLSLGSELKINGLFTSTNRNECWSFFLIDRFLHTMEHRDRAPCLGRMRERNNLCSHGTSEVALLKPRQRAPERHD